MQTDIYLRGHYYCTTYSVIGYSCASLAYDRIVCSDSNNISDDNFDVDTVFDIIGVSSTS